MGDRANIVINSNGGKSPRIFLYGHWSGYGLPRTLQEALKRGDSRWDDESYLSRIIFSQMTKGNEMELIGFGVSTYLCDNEYDLIVVDSDKQQVWLENEEQTKASGPISFAEYVAIDMSARDCWTPLKDRVGALKEKQAEQQAA